MEALRGSTEADLLILMAIIVTGPIVAERFRIPGLVGLIAGGILVGPSVLGWVGSSGLVAELGEIGILYLMFLAGLEFGLRTFLANRRMAVVFGLLGFVVPFVVSIWVGLSALGLGLIGASLVGAMWASNTLVAYPDVQAAGLRENRAVGSAVAAGVIADLLSLTVLAIATSATAVAVDPDLPDTATSEPLAPVWVTLPLLALVTLVLVPRLTRWFFVEVGHSRTQRFVFSLAVMGGAATLATLGGLEGLIGAFLAGLGMNRLVPKSGSLFERVEFVGSTVFVPAFLVSIGLSIDPRLMFNVDTLVLAAIFTGLVVVGKAGAALITGLVFRLAPAEIGIMATLSMGQAASTLAISQVGVELGVFDEQISNAAVLAIVAAVFITSYGTRAFIPRIERPTFTRPPLGHHVLVDTRFDADHLILAMRFAAGVAGPDQGLVAPFAIAPGREAQAARDQLTAAERAAASLGQDPITTYRADDSFADGVVQLAAEHDASLLVLGWEGPRLSSAVVFGSDLDTIGEHSSIPTAAVHLVAQWSRVVVATGDVRTDWRHEDAALATSLGVHLATAGGLPLVVLAPSTAVAADLVGDAEDVEIREEEDAAAAIRGATEGDLLVVPAHALRDADLLGPWRLGRALDGISVAVVGGPNRLAVGARRMTGPVHGLMAGRRVDD